MEQSHYKEVPRWGVSNGLLYNDFDLELAGVKVCAIYIRDQSALFHLSRLKQKPFSVIINTDEKFKGVWEISPVIWQSFASNNIAENKF